MNQDQRLQLQKMITTHGVEDMTDHIRALKHSSILREQSGRLVELKAQYETTDRDVLTDAFQMDAMTECNFLFSYYTDVYNKIRKDELDLTVWYKALDVLRDIEDGKMDQHEGSYRFGILLKEMYVDSALRKAAKLNASERERGAQEETKEPGDETAATASASSSSSMSWADFKRQNGIGQPLTSSSISSTTASSLSSSRRDSDGAALEARVQARLLEKQRRHRNLLEKKQNKNKNKKH